MSDRTQLRFYISAFLTIFFSFAVGALNVGLLYVFGLPLIPWVISAIVLWRTNVSGRKKAAVSFISMFAIPAGFFFFVWSHGITITRSPW